MNEAVTSTCVSSFNSSGEKLGCGGLKRKLKGNSENFVGNFFKKLAEKAAAVVKSQGALRHLRNPLNLFYGHLWRIRRSSIPLPIALLVTPLGLLILGRQPLFGAHHTLGWGLSTTLHRILTPIPDSSQPAAVLAPLRKIAPPGGDTQTSFMVYVPFSTSDLYNWKSQTPAFSEKSQGLTSLLESIFSTHQPTWDDCQQLLQVLFTTEEKEHILREAARGVSDPTGQLTTDPAWVQLVFPSTRPDWNPNTDQGKEALLRYRQLLLQGLWAAARRPVNLSKTLQALHLARKDIRHLVSATRETPGQSLKPHSHSPDDWIWVKKVQPASLEHCWDGPFPVILTTPTAVKVDGRRHWIHHTRIKAAHPPQTSEQWTLRQTEDSLKIRLSRVQSGPS
ncbi:uncharacterized protein LOC111731214 [Pteropus vampyrus]|uniref:Uncharacterized protein LOC111731214 n=1 Tax=Pteropus vampyrus TaxID=132908 RepID=A0A6P6BTM7_PTEVA|nr:uncharacterized protein LOC111731214 [Pteropus vampyrus]